MVVEPVREGLGRRLTHGDTSLGPSSSPWRLWLLALSSETVLGPLLRQAIEARHVSDVHKDRLPSYCSVCRAATSRTIEA